MRLRWMLLLPLLLGPATLAAAQDVTPSPGWPPPVACGEPAPPSPRLWASAEYLLWWTRGARVPAPLVTTSGVADFGVLGAPSTHLLVGNETLELGSRHGGRFTAGLWLDDEQRVGVEGSFFFLGSASEGRGAAVDGFSPRVIAVPFLDVTPGGNFGDPGSVNQENAFVFGAPVGVVTPTGFAGIATLAVRNQLWGAEGNGVVNLAQGGSLRLDLLGGFRYLYLRERLDFNTSSPTVVPSIPGEFFVTSDRFDGRNDFYGGQLGTRLAWTAGALTVTATGKVALGVVQQQLGIGGSFGTNDFNVPFGTGPGQFFPGGYLALPSNSGHHRRDRFAVVPEAAVNLSYRLTQSLAVTMGYTFLYVDNVVRPGEQIGRSVNGGQSPLYAGLPTPGLRGGPAQPAATFGSSEFWAQGLNFGLELRY